MPHLRQVLLRHPAQRLLKALVVDKEKGIVFLRWAAKVALGLIQVEEKVDSRLKGPEASVEN